VREEKIRKRGENDRVEGRKGKEVGKEGSNGKRGKGRNGKER